MGGNQIGSLRVNDNSIKPTEEQSRIIEGAGKHTEMMVNTTPGKLN